MMPDSVAHLRALFLSRTCVADEAPQALAEASGSHVGVVEYTTGIRPEERPLLPGYDDGVTALVTGIFVLLSISVSRHTTFLKTFASALLSGRRRSNTFDDHTVDETRITAALLLICCVCEGILIYFGAVLGGFRGSIWSYRLCIGRCFFAVGHPDCGLLSNRLCLLSPSRRYPAVGARLLCLAGSAGSDAHRSGSVAYLLSGCGGHSCMGWSGPLRHSAASVLQQRL